MLSLNIYSKDLFYGRTIELNYSTRVNCDQLWHFNVFSQSKKTHMSFINIRNKRNLYSCNIVTVCPQFIGWSIINVQCSSYHHTKSNRLFWSDWLLTWYSRPLNLGDWPLNHWVWSVSTRVRVCEKVDLSQWLPCVWLCELMHLLKHVFPPNALLDI